MATVIEFPASLRTSSYTIFVDLPTDASHVLLVHGYSGAYDLVSMGVAGFLRSKQVANRHKPLYGAWSPEPGVDDVPGLTPPSPATVESLRRRGYLTELSLEAEEALLGKIATTLHESQSRRPDYIFMPTYDCNLRCFYCFQDHMRTDPRFKFLLKTMNRELVDRLFLGMANLEAMHGLTAGEVNRRIGFFGGEPLLAANRPIVEYIVERAATETPASFWAVSNATDLDAYQDLLRPDRISQLQITLDGPPKEHDTRRIYADGSGSYERIARNITMALDQKVNVNVRMNIDRNNISQLPELADEVIDRGWDRYPNFSIYAAPIHPSNAKTDRKTTFTTWQLDEAMQQLGNAMPQLQVMDRPDERLKDQARAIFDQGTYPGLKGAFCGAINAMYILDAFADIYACWERTGDQRIRIGRVADDGTVTLARVVTEAWRNRNVANNDVCRKCRFALYCGGGCAVLAEGRRGNMSVNFCDGYAARFRGMVAEAYVEHATGGARKVKQALACDL